MLAKLNNCSCTWQECAIDWRSVTDPEIQPQIAAITWRNSSNPWSCCNLLPLRSFAPTRLFGPSKCTKVGVGMFSLPIVNFRLTEQGGIEPLVSISRSVRYPPSCSKAAATVLGALWKHRSLRNYYRKEGWSASHFAARTEKLPLSLAEHPRTWLM